MKYTWTIGLSLLLTLTTSPLLTAADPPVDTGTQEDGQLLFYTPPKKLTPRARIGGPLRGLDGNEPEIVALVPDHVGWTVRQTPMLNWFLSKLTTNPLRFTLNDDRKVRPIYEGPLSTPRTAGIQSIDLKSLGLNLEPNVQYRWFVSASRNPDAPSQDIVAGGMIERCEFNECLVFTQTKLSCDPESVRTNALNGFWYDAMGCLCTLIDKDPRDPALRRLRAALLRQVGLNVVADWDLAFIKNNPK